MIAVFLGGARSGKSQAAERFAVTLPTPVTYVATWMSDRSRPDPDMDARIAAHRDRRPPAWGLREVGADLPAALRELRGTALVDSLGTWVAGAPDFRADAGALCEALTGRPGDTVIVTEEVGLGVHPSTPAGRSFRDALGAVNEAVVAVADGAWLVVAGRVLALSEPTAGWADAKRTGA